MTKIFEWWFSNTEKDCTESSLHNDIYIIGNWNRIRITSLIKHYALIALGPVKRGWYLMEVEKREHIWEFSIINSHALVKRRWEFVKPDNNVSGQVVHVSGQKFSHQPSLKFEPTQRD